MINCKFRARAIELLSDVPGGVTPGRVAKLARLLESHQFRGVVLKVCADERTGVRFGNAKCRRSSSGERCAEKIGRTTYKYQVWAVWNHAC